MQLVINSPGTFITQKDACFRLKVESIVLSNQAIISTQAVVQALEHNIDVIFLDGYGDTTSRFMSSLRLKRTIHQNKVST